MYVIIINRNLMIQKTVLQIENKKNYILDVRVSPSGADHANADTNLPVLFYPTKVLCRI
jgi:hypothetical protein